jgi:hypothetical protein
MRSLALVLLLGLAFPRGARAQQPDSGMTARAGAVRETEGKLSPRVTPAFGLHYGSPMRISGALGVIIDLDKRSLDGILLVVEPGQHGIEYSAGYLRMIGRFGSGVSARASVLHTFSADHVCGGGAPLDGGAGRRRARGNLPARREQSWRPRLARHPRLLDRDLTGCDRSFATGTVTA